MKARRLPHDNYLIIPYFSGRAPPEKESFTHTWVRKTNFAGSISALWQTNYVFLPQASEVLGMQQLTNLVQSCSKNCGLFIGHSKGSQHFTYLRSRIPLHISTCYFLLLTIIH